MNVSRTSFDSLFIGHRWFLINMMTLSSCQHTTALNKALTLEGELSSSEASIDDDKVVVFSRVSKAFCCSSLQI